MAEGKDTEMPHWPGETLQGSKVLADWVLIKRKNAEPVIYLIKDS